MRGRVGSGVGGSGRELAPQPLLDLLHQRTLVACSDRPRIDRRRVLASQRQPRLSPTQRQVRCRGCAAIGNAGHQREVIAAVVEPELRNVSGHWQMVSAIRAGDAPAAERAAKALLETSSEEWAQLLAALE